MSKGGKTGRTHASPVQTAKIYNLLTEFIHNVDRETGMCEYKNNLDDQKIADMVEGNPSKAAVARIRNEAFGKVAATPGTGMTSRMQAQISDLKHANSALSSRLAELIEKHDKLIDTLALNQIAKVRHLAMASPVRSAG